jgi:putative nucleotidyltransferase with HDIG domain
VTVEEGGNGPRAGGGRNEPRIGMSTVTTPKPAAKKAASERPAGAGGRRLADAFEAVGHMPALAESRRRLLGACQSGSAGEIVAATESDVALTIAVIRAARESGERPTPVASVRVAVDRLGPKGVAAAVANVQTYDPFAGSTIGAARQEQFRRHSVATRGAADRIAEMAGLDSRDELAAAALLHDVGHLVLSEIHGEDGSGNGVPPEEQVRRERRQFGIDHALVGGVLARRWGLRPSAAAAIERHHSPEAQGHAAAIRLADLVAHYVSGDPVPAGALIEAAGPLGIETERVAALVYEFPGVNGSRRPVTEPCPLSTREMDALRGLAEGKVYKQIARELSLSVSTIRTHLHNVYRKIGAVDRAQAVLIARDRGWL